MRTFLVTALTFIFLWQSTAALSAPVVNCCAEDCDAVVCALATCTGALDAVAQPAAPLTRQPARAHTGRPADDASLSNATYAIWRPPD